MSLSPWARRGLSICLYTLLSIAWSWPLSSAPFSTVVSGLDSWGTIWLISVSDSVTLTGQSTAGSWPFVQDLGRSDSVLMMIALCFHEEIKSIDLKDCQSKLPKAPSPDFCVPSTPLLLFR